MNMYDALEAAYKNGFEAGRNSATTHAIWQVVKDPHGMPLRWMCSLCGRITIEASKYCPDCGAEMSLED